MKFNHWRDMLEYDEKDVEIHMNDGTVKTGRIRSISTEYENDIGDAFDLDYGAPIRYIGNTSSQSFDFVLVKDIKEIIIK